MLKELSIGKTYVMLRIDSFLAMCHKTVITITRHHNGRAVYKEKGKRKEYYAPDPVKHDNDVLYFDCAPDAFRVDTEDRGVMRGNACFNFTYPDPEQLKKIIYENCLNATPEMLSHCMYCKGEEEVLLFPDEQTSSALILSKRSAIDRHLEKFDMPQ